MKNVLKTILIIVLIIIAIGFVLFRIGQSKIEDFSSAGGGMIASYFDTYTVKKNNVESYIKSIGTVTSFNIETLDVPVDSTITEVLVKEGQRVEAKQEILKIKDGDGKEKTVKSSISGMFFCVENSAQTSYCIYNLDDMGVKIALSEKDVFSVHVGQQAKVKINAIDKEFVGEVSYVSSLPQNDKFVVKIKINYTDDIKFGYSASTSILSMKKENIISIPYEYLNTTNDGKYYVYKDDQMENVCEQMMSIDPKYEDSWRTYVEVGTITSKNVEIVSGLEEGEKIIVCKY